MFVLVALWKERDVMWGARFLGFFNKIPVVRGNLHFNPLNNEFTYIDWYIVKGYLGSLEKVHAPHTKDIRNLTFMCTIKKIKNYPTYFVE